MKIRNRGRSRSGSVHSGQLERWIGTEAVNRLSASALGWYGPPIAVAGCPGHVYATGDGDFVGELRGGYEASATDYAWEALQGLRRKWRRYVHRSARAQQMNMAIASLNDLIMEASAGKRYEYPFRRAGTTGVVDGTNTLWFVGDHPAAGAAAAAAPGGTVPTDATTGAFPFTNPTSPDIQYFVRGSVFINNQPQTLMLYDRLFSVTKTMNSTATEAVTGVPTRYQSSSAGADDYIGGNFLMIECRTALPATGHNWTVCQYTDQDGNTGVSLPSVTGNASNIVNRLDHPLGLWYCPLASGDNGVKALTQMQCSAAVASGAIDFTIGHPIAFMPCPQVNFLNHTDYVTPVFNLERIFDDAALAFLSIRMGTTVACTFTGQFNAVAG